MIVNYVAIVCTNRNGKKSELTFDLLLAYKEKSKGVANKQKDITVRYGVRVCKPVVLFSIH